MRIYADKLNRRLCLERYRWRWNTRLTESGINGVTVLLEDAAGNTISSTVTSNGPNRCGITLQFYC
ncbi:MAG: hypothetical protein IPH96_17625 [Saprospiraceae bacterium]|nr:hypothetical protein [Saprospiraceae bacterium]